MEPTVAQPTATPQPTQAPIALLAEPKCRRCDRGSDAVYGKLEVNYLGETVHASRAYCLGVLGVRAESAEGENRRLHAYVTALEHELREARAERDIAEHMLRLARKRRVGEQGSESTNPESEVIR